MARTVPAGAREARLPAPPRLDPRLRNALLVLAAGVLALWIAGSRGVHRADAAGIVDTVQAATRGVAASLLLFGVAGLGATRLLLPERLRRYELLWIPAVGACVLGLGMTVLCFLGVPFAVALALVVVASLALAVLVLRRENGAAPMARGVGWPALVAGLLVAVALVPYFAAGFPTVTGVGSDAYHAVGAADFLQHNYPLHVSPEAPLDQMPPLWRSKYPIYYALGAVATVSGLEPYEALAPVAAVVITLGAVGMFLLARELLGAGLLGGVAAMSVSGLNAMVLATALHPYFNQTWGYFAFPFSLVLAWIAVRDRSRAAAALLAIFMMVGALAYPLALPLPALALAVFLALDVRERRRRGEPSGLPSPRRLWRGPRSLVWMVPVALLLWLPVAGALQKIWSATLLLLDPNSSLKDWGGDLFEFIPAYRFFSLPSATLWGIAVAAMCLLTIRLLRDLPRPLGWGIGTVLVAFLLAGAWFRQRDYGWYFEFKTLAFAAPLLVVCAAVALSRFRRAGPVLLALFILSAHFSAREEVRSEAFQLTKQQIDLREWKRDIPRDASVRLDTRPSLQLWISYMLSGRRLCSQVPLLHTDYPHVLRSRRADLILVDQLGHRYYRRRPPPDSTGELLRRNAHYRLYRAKPGLPGRERCSVRVVYGD